MRTREVIFRKALDAAVMACNVDRDYVLQKNRRRRYVDARRMISACLYDLGFHYQDIADFLQCNRSSVYHLLKTHEQYVETDKAYNAMWVEYQYCHAEEEQARKELMQAVLLKKWATENIDRKLTAVPRKKFVDMIRYVKNDFDQS